MAKYHILSMDGGGVRGIITARLLERIEADQPGFLSKVNLFAGTSTGSILAIGLAKGLSASQLVTLYEEQGKVIFEDSILHDIGDLWGLTGARYSTANRYRGIHPTIGDITLDDLLPPPGAPPKNVLVSSFELDSHNPIAPHPGPRTWKPKFFHNFPGSDSDSAQKAIDVIMRSSAAPTYFPIFQGFVDGGVVANNPSMCALAQALQPSTGGQNLNEVVLLSVGTGNRLQYITSTDGDWGLKQWGFKLIDLLFDADTGLADYQCQQLLGDRYARVNPELDEPIGLDAVNRIPQLKQAADQCDLTSTLGWVQEQWMPG